MNKSEAEFVEVGNSFYINDIDWMGKGEEKKRLSKQTFPVLPSPEKETSSKKITVPPVPGD